MLRGPLLTTHPIHYPIPLTLVSYHPSQALTILPSPQLDAKLDSGDKFLMSPSYVVANEEAKNFLDMIMTGESE